MDDHRKRAGDVAPTSPNKRPRVDPPLDPTALAAQIAEKKRLLQQQLQANGIASAPSPMPTGAPGHVRPAMPGAQQQQPRPTAQQQYQMPAAQQQYQQPPANAMLQAQEKARALAARFGATGVQPSAHNIPATQQQYHQRPPSNAAYTAHMSYALPPAPPKKGLFAEIHPALVVDKTTGQLDIKRESGAPLVPKAAFATTMVGDAPRAVRVAVERVFHIGALFSGKCTCCATSRDESHGETG